MDGGPSWSIQIIHIYMGSDIVMEEDLWRQEVHNNNILFITVDCDWFFPLALQPWIPVALENVHFVIPIECPLDTDLIPCDVVQQVGSLTFHVIVAQEINSSCSLTPLCVYQLAAPISTDLGMVKLLNNGHYTPFTNLQHGGQCIVVM
jgi:hypothetical protein